MAVVKLGTTVVGIRGTLGGVTYSAGKAGCYARQWSKGTNPKSTLQQVVRSTLSQYGTIWRGVSPALRADWNAFGDTPPEVDRNSLGEIILLSGWQWFVRVNQRLTQCGFSVRTAVPDNVAQSAPTGFSLALGQLPGGACAVSWDEGSIPSDCSGVLELCLNTGGGAAVPGDNWIRVWSAYAPAGGSADIASAVQGRYGAIRSGWLFFGRLYNSRNDGVRSVAASASTVVT